MKTVFDNITINSTLQSHVFSQYVFVTLQNKDYSSQEILIQKYRILNQTFSNAQLL